MTTNTPARPSSSPARPKTPGRTTQGWSSVVPHPGGTTTTGTSPDDHTQTTRSSQPNRTTTTCKEHLGTPGLCTRPTTQPDPPYCDWHTHDRRRFDLWTRGQLRDPQGQSTDYRALTLVQWNAGVR